MPHPFCCKGRYYFCNKQTFSWKKEVGAGCYQPRGKDFVNIEIKNTFANIKLNKDNSKFYPNNNRFLTQIYNFAQKNAGIPPHPHVQTIYECYSNVIRPFGELKWQSPSTIISNRCFYVLDVTGGHFKWIPLHRPSNTFASVRFTHEWYPANNSLYHIRRVVADLRIIWFYRTCFLLIEYSPFYQFYLFIIFMQQIMSITINRKNSII